MADKWLALGPTETGNASHVIPVGDLIQHSDEDDGSCVCGPTVEHVEPDGWLYTHHSLDAREAKEATNGA